jgi:signal transduction histidine kinase
VQAIQRSGQRANTVVKRLLSTARRNSNDQPQWVDVHQTVRNTLELVSTHIERGRVRFEVDLDTAQPSFARAMPGHLEDVWLNLLINARDALTKAAPGAAMGITTRRAAQTLDVLVWDKGPGIPAEFKDRIFEPFFTTKPTGEGTGLGLYICKQVITEIGGQISVDTSLGQGTCFRVTLPVSDKGA